MFIFLLNLAVGIGIQLSWPGTAYANPLSPDINASEYEAHFNSTEIAGWGDSSPFSGIPLIGDIYAGFNYLWNNIKYLVDGFPTLLTWVSESYITDPAGQFAFGVIANALRAVYAFLIAVFLIEFISGRNPSD